MRCGVRQRHKLGQSHQSALRAALSFCSSGTVYQQLCRVDRLSYQQLCPAIGETGVLLGIFLGRERRRPSLAATVPQY